MPVDVLATYYTAYLLLPKLLYPRKYVVFISLFLLGAFGAILLQRFILYEVSYPYFLGREAESPFWQINWFYSFTNIYLVVFAVSGFKLLQRNFKEEKNLQELNEKRVEAELKFLKAQVHPHFLFNTLNNLYALTLDKSPKSSEVVLKLSELLNYMLYECNEPTILVSKEIKLIENYLSLETIRYQDSLSLDFKVTGEIAAKKIAPMLLLPFVENAFKHGVSRLNKGAKVMVNLHIQEDELHFQVSNSKPAESQVDPAGYTEGIGLKNVKRRLELIYPNRHEMLFQPTDREFVVFLKLKL